MQGYLTPLINEVIQHIKIMAHRSKNHMLYDYTLEICKKTWKGKPVRFFQKRDEPEKFNSRRGELCFTLGMKFESRNT